MLCKLFFYLVVIPLSWLPLPRTATLYRKTYARCWPEQSLEFVAVRDAAIMMALQRGYVLRPDGTEILAYRGFRDVEIIVADNVNPLLRWQQAHRWIQMLE